MNKKKMLNKILLCLITVYPIILSGCKEQNKKEIPSNEIEVVEEKEEEMELDSNCLILKDIPFDNKEEFFRIIEKDRKKFYSYESRKSTDQYVIQYRNEFTLYIFPIFSYWLEEKKHYTTVSDSIFNARVKEIFNINLSDKCDKILRNKDYIEYVTDYINEMSDLYDLLSDGSFLFSTKYKLFFRPPFNGLLLEETNLSQQYQCCFPNNEYHYNQFIFHDSKSSLTWLINNDLDFLEILVREFGYDKEPKINKAILNKAIKEYYSTQPYDKEVLKNLFVRRSCNNKLEIRNGLFKSIIENTTNDNKELYDMLNDNISDVLLDYEPYTLSPHVLKLTVAEKAELLAYFASMETEIFDRYRVPSWPYHTLTYGILNNSTDDYRKIWEENNYYNIPNFNHVLESLDLENEPLP